MDVPSYDGTRFGWVEERVWWDLDCEMDQSLFSMDATQMSTHV